MKIFQAMRTGLAAQQVRIGWFESAKYASGTPVAYVASIHEFGYPEGNIPPRLGLRSMQAAKAKDWKSNIEVLGKRVASGKMTPTQALNSIGLFIEGDIKAQIRSVKSPALQQVTIDARLHRYKDKKTLGNLSKPLVDTGLMLASVSYNIVQGGKP